MTTVILHVSDIHFSQDNTDENDARTLALEGLLKTLSEQSPDWLPSIVCLTGDIARRGKNEDYVLAGAWLNKLLRQLDVSREALFICPGNHDVDRDHARSIARPACAPESDTVLAFPPIANHYASIFDAYSKWAEQFGLKPYKLGEHENYLVGHRSYQGISFVALNTAWSSKDDADKEQLWLGFPQIKHLEVKGQFAHEHDRSSLPVTFTLLHHPKEWLHPDESRAAGMRPNVWDYMGIRTDVILSGHTHGEVRRADTIAETALHFTAGAVYPGKNEYFNNFRLLRVENGRVSYKTFEFDSRSTELQWQSKIADTCSLPRRSSATRQIRGFHADIADFDVATFRAKTEWYAKRVLETKSRAVKPYGTLPELTTLPVTIKVQQEKRDEQNISRNVRPLILPFEDALGKSRRTLLLGELGTGKSTVAARSITAVQSQSNSGLAFLIPAKQLELPDKISPGNLLDVISTFISNSIAPDSPPIRMQSLLRAKIETTIFLDGLDEIESTKIGTLLREFAAIPEHWETATVVAIGRPIELSGSSYSEWQIVTTTMLTEEEKQHIFENEALAEGRPPRESKEYAIELLNRIRKAPALAQLISTPLAARLFYFRLSKTTSPDVLTLGDLAYETIHDRLATWAKKDDKQKTTEYFETYFPDAESRSTLLGLIALELSKNARLTVAEVRRAIAARCKDIGAQSAACAMEALDFFGKSGLLAVDGDVVQFPVNIFLQTLIGIGIEASWSSGTSSDISIDQWREVAFAAATSRRKASLSTHVSYIKRFISQLAAHDSFVPAAAQIVTESKSQELGEHFVKEASARKSVGIRFFDDEWDESARAIATALKISGRAGFAWFYDKYLDPKYPFVFYGSGLIGAVFKEWVRLSIGNVAPDEKQKIEQAVVPMLKADTIQVHDIAAAAVFVVPDVFDVGERLVFMARGLATRQFSELAASELKKYMGSENRQICEAALLGAGSPLAALIWLDYNPGIPPSTILITAVRSLTDSREHSGEQLVDSCKRIVGLERWLSFLRFTLFHPEDKVSAGAALGLYDAGEQDPVFLRTPLVKALHDGGYVPRAEQVLGDLLAKAESKSDAVEWLANIVHDHWLDISGGHSGEFRLLLKNLPETSNGSSLLAWAIIGLGQFVLPRYPEVRQQFRDLLSGADGNEYRRALEEKLESTNSIERRAAAAVLVTSFPDEESRALQVIVKSVAGGWGMRWHEWEDYLLSINFGIAPLSSLKSNLATFPKEAAHFGYRLLLNNAVDLTEEEQMQALQGILEYRYRLREMEIAFLKSSKAKSGLLTLVTSAENAHSRGAAELLLRLHKDSLSVGELALCSALSITGGQWDRYALADQIEKLRTDSQYSAAVADLGLKHKQEHSSELFLDLLRASIHDQSVWDDIVWEVMCKERVPSQPEETALWLLETGLGNPTAAAAIGRSAQKCLSEFPKRPFGSIDVYQWLALLVDEFIGVPKQELERIVVSSQPIHREVTAALLFRLGSIPAIFRARPYTPPRISRSADAYSKNELQDASRQMDGLPSDLCERIESTIIYRAVSSAEIDNIRGRGSNGALIASVLAFTQGIPPSPDYVVSVLPLLEIWRRPQQPGCLDRLLRTSMTSQYERLKAGATSKLDLITKVEKTFAASGNTGELALLLLELRGYLTGIEAHKFFDHLARLGYSASRELQEQVVRWLLRVPSNYVDEKSNTLEAITVSLAAMAEKKTDKDPALFGEAISDLTLALGFWRLSDKEEVTATNAFWRGLKTLFREKASQPFNPIVEAFEILEPLLSAVNPDLLRSAIASRRLDSDPFVRASSVIFSSFGGTRKS